MLDWNLGFSDSFLLWQVLLLFLSVWKVDAVLRLLHSLCSDEWCSVTHCCRTGCTEERGFGLRVRGEGREGERGRWNFREGGRKGNQAAERIKVLLVPGPGIVQSTSPSEVEEISVMTPWSPRWIFCLVLVEVMVSLVSAANYPHSYYRRVCYRPHCYHGYSLGRVASGKSLCHRFTVPHLQGELLKI